MVSVKFETKDSGPLKVAVFDMRDFKGELSLGNPSCREKVIRHLETESNVQRVILLSPITRVYCSEDLSRLAQTIATAKRLALDDSMYGGGNVKKCKKCISERSKRVLNSLESLEANPHEFNTLHKLGDFKGLKGACRKCTEENFNKLIGVIIDLFKDLKIMKKLTSENYREIFKERQKPFFVDGIWNPPPPKSKLIDSYKLTGNRGIVKIYERLDNPVPFYELELPEFKLPYKYLELLDAAFNFKLEGAPGHARFAYSDRMHAFAKDWYNVLLHMLKGRKEKIPSTDLENLAKLMASWLTYRILEPLSHDDFITDVYISAPPELQPIFVEHERWGKLETGICWDTPSLLNLGEVLASRLGTSFDEVRPQLDAEIPELGMRLFLSRYPAIWERSVEVAVRKRRSNPWTQPLFIQRGTLTPLASSFLSSVLRLGSSAFVIGEMGTAKTSQVETYIPEIGPQNRIVAFQDTEELHIQEFLNHGYKVANVRIADSEHLERQINSFLRGGASYWLITEVRSSEAVRAALGAAARQGSQPVVASFHARSKREMFDLVVHIMGLHEAAFRYVDFIISTARFSTPSGTVRRIVEIAEVRKDWRGEPKYVEIFADDRKRDLLIPKNFLKGPKPLIKRLNSSDLSKIDILKSMKRVRFLPPERGGSHIIPQMCRRLGLDERDLLAEMLVEARVKSDLLNLSKRNPSFLELPFVSRAYNAYFSSLKRHAPDFKRVLGDWRNWLKRV